MRALALPSRLWLWTAFIAVNVWLCWIAFWGPGYALGDVYLYRYWVELGMGGGPWVGLDTSWVYPILALFPITVAAVGGSAGYIVSWLLLVVLLNCAALACLTGWTSAPRNISAGWFWTVFLLLLGPIAVGRVDSISVPLAMMGITFLATRPFVAGVLLAAATWIKVWPAAVIAAAVVADRRRWFVVAGAAALSIAVVGLALVLGGGGSILSFITEQTGRGLQIESPVGGVWLWMAIAGVAGAGLYYDREILTYQVTGPGADAVAQLMTPLLAVGMVAVVSLALWLLSRRARAAALLPPLMLALVTMLIVVNKVGSPQFVAWLAVPIAYGVAASLSADSVSFRVPVVLSLATAGLTQIVYPYLYGHLLGLEVFFVVVLTVRNVLLLAILVWSIRAMVRAPRTRRGVTT